MFNFCNLSLRVSIGAGDTDSMGEAEGIKLGIAIASRLWLTDFQGETPGSIVGGIDGPVDELGLVLPSAVPAVILLPASVNALKPVAINPKFLPERLLVGFSFGFILLVAKDNIL